MGRVPGAVYRSATPAQTPLDPAPRRPATERLVIASATYEVSAQPPGLYQRGSQFSIPRMEFTRILTAAGSTRNFAELDPFCHDLLENRFQRVSQRQVLRAVCGLEPPPIAKNQAEGVRVVSPASM